MPSIKLITALFFGHHCQSENHTPYVPSIKQYSVSLGMTTVTGYYAEFKFHT